VIKKKTAGIVKSKFFKVASIVLGILFIILTYFISISPDSFLQYGYAGVFVFNVISSGLLIMPVLVDKLNIFLVVLVSAFGNILSTSINYLVGNTSNHLFSKNPIVIMLKKWMERFDLFIVYILAIVPLPLDVNGLLSGYVGIPYKRYIFVNFLGKVTVFLLVAFGIITVSQTMKK
jgi:membrane protein YqaA with SNARE-associated domain